MALSILTGSSQAAAFNYSYTTSGSADWASVPTASYFYDIVDKTVRFKATNSTFSNVATASFALTASNVTSASYALNSTSASYASSSTYSDTAGSSTTTSDATSIASAITNNTDNYLLTATGTGTITGENLLTFDGTTLTAQSSVVQGDGGSAVGLYSHVEGARSNAANGDYSHAEGDTTQTGFDQGYLALINDGTCSLDLSYGDVTADYTVGDTLLISSGTQTFTSIISSINFISGQTILSTNLAGLTINPVTIGNLTTGIGTWSGGYPIGGTYSHAEGIGTIALGSGQHVSGQYNTPDATSLFIVGNGISDGARSDAFKVTPSGSIVLPVIQSSTPTWDGTPGEMIFGDNGIGVYTIYVWLDGRWRSSSLI